ncbi:hypothetical protein BJX65DRAFT_275956 [Aspergillus insuetus]
MLAVICLNIPAIRCFVIRALGRLGFSSCGSTASTYETPRFEPNHPLRINRTITATVTSRPPDQFSFSDALPDTMSGSQRGLIDKEAIGR